MESINWSYCENRERYCILDNAVIWLVLGRTSSYNSLDYRSIEIYKFKIMRNLKHTFPPPQRRDPTKYYQKEFRWTCE